jgi:hypothetical protein
MAGGKGKSSGGKSSGGKTSGADGSKKQQSHSARAGLQVSAFLRVPQSLPPVASSSRRITRNWHHNIEYSPPVERVTSLEREPGAGSNINPLQDTAYRRPSSRCMNVNEYCARASVSIDPNLCRRAMHASAQPRPITIVTLFVEQR